MNGSKHAKKANKRYAIIIIICFVMACVGILTFFLCRSPLNISKSDNPIGITTSMANPNSIAIPGYEGISLKANSLKQDIALENPSQNTCYFVIALYLEDGTLLWESDYIKPGNNSSPVVLTQELPEGTYANAILKYSCFKMDDEKTPLNGAETKLTLRVK